MVKARVRAAEAAGINCLRIGPQGKTAAEQIADLEMTVDLIQSATS